MSRGANGKSNDQRVTPKFVVKSVFGTWLPVAFTWGVTPLALLTILHYWRPNIDWHHAIDQHHDWRDIFSVVAGSAATVWAVTFAIVTVFNVKSIAQDNTITGLMLRTMSLAWFKMSTVMLSGFLLTAFVLSLLGLVPQLNARDLGILSGVLSIPWWILVASELIGILRSSNPLLKRSGAVIARTKSIFIERERIVEALLPYLPGSLQQGRPSIPELKNVIPLPAFGAPPDLAERILRHNDETAAVYALTVGNSKMTVVSEPALGTLQGGLSYWLLINLLLIPGTIVNLVTLRPTVEILAWCTIGLMVVGLVISVRLLLIIVASNMR